MEFVPFALLAAWCAADRICSKRFPRYRRFWERMELPMCVTLSAVVLIYCGFLFYAVYDTLAAPVSKGDKVFMVIFIGIIVSVHAAMTAIVWRDWWKKRKKEPPA